MAKVYLQTPITEEQIRSLKLEDEVYLSGDAYCMLYADHYKLILDACKAGEQPPMDMRGSAIYNTGVIWRRDSDGNSVLYALGTTASYKFNAYTPELIRAAGIRAVIGKGGMNDETLSAMKECGCAFLAIPGGCTSIFTPRAEIAEEYSPKIPELDNQRLRFKFDKFGPLMVTMDANGNSVYHEIAKNLEENTAKIYERLQIKTENGKN